MGLVVKICGLTREDAIEAVNEAGVQRAGFVFAASPRQVTPTRAAALAARLSPEIERVAVLKSATQALVDEILTEFPADWLQADATSLGTVCLPAGVKPMPVVRDGEVDALVALPAALLYEAPMSGQGMRADWRAAARLAERSWLMLAGGLDGDNIAAAVTQVRPAGVDVSSGVECAPGVKDPALITVFARQAHAAGAVLESVP